MDEGDGQRVARSGRRAQAGRRAQQEELSTEDGPSQNTRADDSPHRGGGMDDPAGLNNSSGGAGYTSTSGKDPLASSQGRSAYRSNGGGGGDDSGADSPLAGGRSPSRQAGARHGGDDVDHAVTGRADSEAGSPQPPARKQGFSAFNDDGGGEDGSNGRGGNGAGGGPGAGAQQGRRGAPAGGAAAPPSKQLDMLADDAGDKKFAGVSRRKQEQNHQVDEEKVKRGARYDDLANREESILEIPELEEEGKEDLTRLVAEAPKVRFNKVQDIAELDEDMQFQLPHTDDRDIDLSLLTAVLCSSEQVQEDDEVWDPDMLFTQVASELNQEKEKAEGEVEPDQPSDPLAESNKAL